MWLRTKTDSGADVLINFDHVTHVFGNPYGALVVLDNNEQNVGIKNTLSEVQTALEVTGERTWGPNE